MISLCLLHFCCDRLAAQDCHVPLRGHIIDAESRAPLPYASIFIQEVKRNAVADEQGNFSIANLCEGAVYTVEVSHVECQHLTQSIRLTEGNVYAFSLQHHAHIKEVVVSEKAVTPPPAQARAQVEAIDLEAGKGLGLAETLRNTPGVSVLNTGSTIGKPIIQGLHSNRIAIVDHNVVLESQQWGSDHAPEIDPYTAGEIKVVKGAAGVRYGVSALAGAVVLEPPPLRKESGFGGWTLLSGFSNGWGGVAATALDWRASGRRLGIRVQGTLKRSGNLRTPDYWLQNTGVAEQNGQIILEWAGTKLTNTITISHFGQKLGILRTAHIGNLSDLQTAIGAERPVNNVDRFSYSIERPFQQVIHQSLQYRGVLKLSEKWRLNGQYAWQYNDRGEYDILRSSNSSAQQYPQVAFRMTTHTADVSVEHRPVRHWQGGLGVQASQQMNLVGRGGYIPDFTNRALAVWLLERKRRYPKPWEIEFGFRYDLRQSKVVYAEGTFLPAGIARDTQVLFHNFSGTGGLIYHFTDYAYMTLHSGLAMRPPHVYELFARGVHFASATYEQGNRYMKPEIAWNTSLSFSWQRGAHNLSASVYRNRINHFIFLEPADALVLTVRGAFPLYQYTQTNAVLYGLDAAAAYAFYPEWTLEGRASLLRAQRKGEGDAAQRWLPLMPADRYQIGLKWQTKATGTDAPPKRFVRLWGNYTARQSRVPEKGLLMPVPAAFITWSLDAGMSFAPSRSAIKRRLELGISIQNLTNIRYRDYLNFFRFYTDERGFNAGVRIKYTF